MRIEKTYRQLEDFEEVHIYDITEHELFQKTPQEFEMSPTPFEKTLDEISNDLDIFVPYDDNGNDFIIRRLGLGVLRRSQFSHEEAEGRLLSKVSPGYYKLLQKHLTLVSADNIFIDGNCFKQFKVVNKSSKHKGKLNLSKFQCLNH